MDCISPTCKASHGEDSWLMDVGMNQHLELSYRNGKILMGLFGPRGSFKAFMRISPDIAKAFGAILITIQENNYGSQ